MKNTRTIVVCHGYNLAEDPHLTGVRNQRGESIAGKFNDWTHVCLGGQGLRGRIPQTLHAIEQYAPVLVVWTTGCSWLPDGRSEAKVMMELAQNMLVGAHAPSNAADIISTFMAEEISTRTSETLAALKRMIDTQFPQQEVLIVHVSSNNHTPRILRDALAEFANHPLVENTTSSAQTSYAGGNPGQVDVYDLGRPVSQVDNHHCPF